MKKIEKECWKAIEDVSGRTKEEFELGVVKQKEAVEEIEEFLDEIGMLTRVSKQIQHNVTFDPFLFMIWRLVKKNG